VAVTFTAEPPDSADASGLIAELDALLEPLYPRESRHGYSVAKLIAQGVAFFVLRTDGAPAGCGGVQMFADGYGELKRMYVRPRFRGRGLGRMLLGHLEAYVRGQGAGLVRLETGVHQGAAIRLYERMGYRRIPPFGGYVEDPVSLCYERRVQERPRAEARAADEPVSQVRLPDHCSGIRGRDSVQGLDALPTARDDDHSIVGSSRSRPRRGQGLASPGRAGTAPPAIGTVTNGGLTRAAFFGEVR
jgi:putative acetyltransferase